MHSADSAGRRHPEPPHPYRGPYQRDRDRILHSAAFRRLSQKTQVFTGEMGDYHRTRLTHTLEVASIARTIARACGSMKTWSKRWRWRTTSATRRSATRARTCSNECLRDAGRIQSQRAGAADLRTAGNELPRFSRA